jgi:type II secretory pathway component PulF
MDPNEAIKSLVWTVVMVILYVAPFCLLYLTYWLLSLPLRRRERARQLLDLLELGLADGHSPEHAIVHAAQSNDPTLGDDFQALASFLQSGMKLHEGLRKIPRLLPPPVVSMLAVGAELGDLRRVLPPCRQALDDAISQTRGALNYLAILIFVVLPFVPVVSIMLSVFVLPRFEQIAADMEVGLPRLSQTIFGLRSEFIWIQLAVMFFFQLLMICYIAGPRLRAGLNWPDRILWLLPWRRKRMQRDFGTMLALLLDAGVPEQRAVLLAAESADNSLFTRRAQQAAAQISAGVKIDEAVRVLDDSGEFHWRLTNAKHGPQGFIAALRGWFEALDARAFQQEQAAAQTLTTLLVLWNGFVIGAFVIGMFSLLVNIIEEGVLW